MTRVGLVYKRGTLNVLIYISRYGKTKCKTAKIAVHIM